MKTLTNAGYVLSSKVLHQGDVSVPEMVARGVERCNLLRVLGARPDYDSPLWLRFIDRQAHLYRREARWWGVLIDWAYSSRSGDLERIFGRAAIIAQASAEQRASHHEQIAENSRRRIAVLAGEL